MTDQRKYVSKLAGKHVLIIGGSAGIGYGVAEASLEHGATVTISSSNASRLSAAVQSLAAAYPTAASEGRIPAGVVCDLGTEDALEANIVALFTAVTTSPSPSRNTAAAATTTTIDHVVYTAGDALAAAPLADATVALVRRAGTVRYLGPLATARTAAGHLPPGSSITLTSGLVGQRPVPGWSAVAGYATALFGLARALALDLAGKGIRVNCVAPGAVDTGLWDAMPEGERGETFRAFEEKMPTGRVGRVEDVAEAYLYLMRDGNATGSVVSTNGGALLV